MYPSKATDILKAISIYQDKMEAVRELADSLRNIIGPANYANFINEYFSSYNDNMKNFLPKQSLVKLNNLSEKLRSNLTCHWDVKPSKSEPKTRAPNSRWGHSCIVHDNEMLIFGGTGDDAKTYNDTYAFSLTEHTWRKLI